MSDETGIDPAEAEAYGARIARLADVLAEMENRGGNDWTFDDQARYVDEHLGTGPLESVAWERDVALSRVAAAEAVQGRMADSLPDSGPWESWSERDRAVRDYEGDLSTALSVEDDTVGERLREVERERDEARAEVAQLRVNYQDAIDEGMRRGGQIAELQEALYKRRVETARMRPVVAAAEAWDESWVLGEADVVKHTALHNFVAAYRAALSAPVETDATEPAPECPACRGTNLVCEDHPDHIWGGIDGTEPPCCGGAGTPCPRCRALAEAGAPDETDDICARLLDGDGEVYICKRSPHGPATRDDPHDDLDGVQWWDGEVHTIRPAGAPDEPTGDTAPPYLAAFERDYVEALNAILASQTTDADVYRWRGHAESRRQVCERIRRDLGLPAANYTTESWRARNGVYQQDYLDSIHGRVASPSQPTLTEEPSA